MAVIVVDVLEIVDVEEREREPAVLLTLLQEAVGAMFDHAPHWQAGEFVVIGRAEQMILKGLLLADLDRARKQQVAVRNTNRPVGGEKDLFGLAAAHGFFRDGGAAGLAKTVRRCRRRQSRAALWRHRSPAGSGRARRGP